MLLYVHSSLFLSLSLSLSLSLIYLSSIYLSIYHLSIYLFIFLNFLLDIFFIYISNAILKVPYTLPATLLQNPLAPASYPRHSLVLGHMIFTRPRASPPIYGQLGHPLLYMQLETQLCEGTG